MSEMELKTEVEAQEFTDELSDEALDRAEGFAAKTHVRMSAGACGCACACACVR